MFSKRLSQSTKQKTNTSLFQSGSENEVSPCFELKYNFLERYKKPLTIPSTRKRQNHNRDLDEKMADANEQKASKQSSAAEEATGSIVTYIDYQMATFSEVNFTSPEYKERYSYNTALILSS